MAHLLLMYQYLRTKREVNKLTLRQIKASRRKDRVAKNIEQVQKMYAARIKRVESDAKSMTTMATNSLKMANGIGMGSFNPYSSAGMYNYGGMTAYVNNYMKTALGTNYDRLMTAYQQYGSGFGRTQDSTGTVTYQGGVSEAEVAQFNQVLYQANQAQQYIMQQTQQMADAYANNVSIWQEAQIAALEEEQDAALSPLEFEQTMWELEEDTTAAELEKKKQDMQHYKEALAEAAKESAVSFGLA